jgi:hypothetical protein
MRVQKNPQQQREPEEITSRDSLHQRADQTSEIMPSTEAPHRNSIRRGTGPRTLVGKQRSKHNATKHGIFSSVAVLKSESRTEYESLLNGLWETLLPEGRLEELLVEKLATIAWRHRRLLIAEGAEIQKGTDFVEWDQRNQEQQEAEETQSSSLLQFNGGLMREVRNPDVLERCLELLADLRQGLETDGFNETWDTSILEKIYGDNDRSHCAETLYHDYIIWSKTAVASEEERQREGYAAPEQCKQNMLHCIDGEVRHLKRYQKTRASVEANRTKLEVLRRSVPESPELDRLLRYEASLERAFDRALSQLERLQRMRKGQPVAPRIDVNLSA